MVANGVDKILAIAYAVNGVSGEPYYVLTFERYALLDVGDLTKETKEYLAVVFDQSGFCAVLQEGGLIPGEVKADAYEPELRKVIEAWENQGRGVPPEEW